MKPSTKSLVRWRHSLCKIFICNCEMLGLRRARKGSAGSRRPQRRSPPCPRASRCAENGTARRRLGRGVVNTGKSIARCGWRCPTGTRCIGRDARRVARCMWRCLTNPRRTARNGQCITRHERDVATNAGSITTYGRCIIRRGRCLARCGWRCPTDARSITRSRRRMAKNGRCMARHGRDVARNGRRIAGPEQSFLTRACRRSRYADRCTTSSRESTRPSWCIGRVLVSNRSDCVGHRHEDVGVQEEERGKHSELEAHGCGCLGMLEVFGQHSCERVAMHDPFGAMRDPFATMPDANGEACSVIRIARRRVGSDAPVGRRDVLRRGRHSPPVPRDASHAPPDAAPVPRDFPPMPGHAAPVPRDASPAPPDALPVPGDAPRIRSDAVRRRSRRSLPARRPEPAVAMRKTRTP
jgi:hypothetical protein